ncbi:MAG TPA: Ig-like domain-containing protein [Gemmatimonadales bacterium]
MSQPLRRLIPTGAMLGAIALLSQCSGSDITLPGEAAPAAITKVFGDLQNGSAGAPLGDSLIVSVVDRSGDPVPRQRVAFSLDQESEGAQITPEATTGSDGRASAAWVLGITIGTQSVTASVVGNDDLQVTFQADAEPAQAERLEYVSGDAQTAAVGTAVPNPLVVRATDQFGNPVAGVEVQWEAGSGSVDPTSSLTGPNGQAEAQWVMGSSTGTHTATASNGDLDGSPITFSGTAVPGTASRLVLVSGNNQSADPGQELANPLVVRLLDADGNGVPGRAVSWVVATGGGSVSTASSNTDGNGEAQVRWTLGPVSGLNTLNAVVSGIDDPVVAFRATADGGGGGGGGGSAPTQLRFVVQPSDTEEDTEISPAVQIEVLDQNGTRVTEADVEIKLELSGDDDGEIKGKDKERTHSGLATFDDLEIDKEGEYRLRATANGLPAIESNTFVVHDD